MKKLLITTLLLSSTTVFAGGSETNPLLETISFDGYAPISTDIQTTMNSSFNFKATPQPLKLNGTIIVISNPIISIDSDVDDGEGGVESKPKVPSPYPQFNPPEEDEGGVETEGGSDDNLGAIQWPNPIDDNSDFFAMPAKGGSETIVAPVKWASVDFPLEVETIRYFSDSGSSVVLQINNKDQFVKLKNSEIFKIKNLGQWIEESARQNSSWVKTY